MHDAPRSWSPFRNNRDTDRFCRLVFHALASRGLHYAGTPPVLMSASVPSKVMYLDNVALRCAGLPRSLWPAVVGEFVDTIAYMDTIDDPTALSPEVARASLRLRLAVEPSAPDAAGVDGAGAGVGGGGVGGDGVGADPFRLREVLRRPALPGTVWLLYLQIPGGAYGLRAEHLDGWGIGVEEAFELARRHAEATRLPPVRRHGPVSFVDSPSMFTHTAVLRPEALIPGAPDGWFVAVPSREKVIAVRAHRDEVALRSLVRLVDATLASAGQTGYPLSLSPWFVSSSGLGAFGEGAEAINLHFDPLDGRIERVRFGPQLHELLADLDDQCA